MSKFEQPPVGVGVEVGTDDVVGTTTIGVEVGPVLVGTLKGQ